MRRRPCRAAGPSPEPAAEPSAPTDWLVPGVNYVGGSRQLRRRVTPSSLPALAGGGDSEN
jgi:hypothetical protein